MFNLPIAVGNLPVTANDLPLVPIGCDIEAATSQCFLIFLAKVESVTSKSC